MKYSDYYFFNENDSCFYLEDNKTTFKYLYETYKNDETKTKINNNDYFITFQNNVYQLTSPGNVTFFFPDGSEKEIFISYYKQIKKILSKYQSYDFSFCKDESNNYVNFNINDVMKIYPVKKIKISIKQYLDIYNFHGMIINNYTELNPKNLSLQFEKYLKYSSNIKENSNFFHLTKEREEFFATLDSELKNKYTFLPICGPEGIGKTSSILAYCKMILRKDYFYYNARTFAELLNANNYEEIKKVLIEELSHCLLSYEIFNAVEEILKFKSFNCSTLEFLCNILIKIEIPGVLIIDQYKTALDKDYNFLKNLLNKFQTSLNIILLSSMNEEDVKQSIVNGIKKENTLENNFFLDYLYIGKLAYVSDNYIKRLNVEEKEVLESFGNLYSIFYEIMEFKKINENKFIKSDFLEKIQGDIINNLKIYYKDKDKTKLYKILYNLTDIELTTLKKDNFLNLYENIPFRYVQLKIDGNSMFKISKINEKSNYEFQYIFNFFNNIIMKFKGKLYKDIQEDENLSESVKKEIQPLKFENNALQCIFGNKKFNGDIITNKLNVTSIYNLNEEDIARIKEKKNKIKNGDGLILFQTNPKAAFFDSGILIKINDNEWKLYLIQITTKKNEESLLTLTFLNDFFGYIYAFLKEKCEIIVTKNYFCYIFDENSKDINSIEYCKKRKIDYLFYNESANKLNYLNKKLNEYKMTKKIFEYDNKFFSYEKYLEIKKFYPKDMNFENTKNFLRRKRKLMDNKNYNAETELVKRVEKKNEYYKSFKSNFQKIKKLDYNDREEEINNYLLGKDEFNSKDLIGIQISVPDQQDCFNQLKDLGLSDIEINNFFAKIEKEKENLVILNIEEIEYVFPSSFIPEYNTFIIANIENKKFYQDYRNKKSFILSENKEVDFIKLTNEDCKGIVISLINKNLSREKTTKKFKISNINK